MDAIEVNRLSKAYGQVQALDEVSFSVARGELFGLIGPDGAGKTTLFRLLTTLISPDGGSATVEGLDTVGDYRRIRELVGYMPGRFSLYPDLTVEENLNFFAALFGTKVEEAYDLVAPIYKQIEPFKTRRAGKLSGGMKQKLALSCALIHRPSVLFLDEPTTGVDAVSRGEFWDMLSNLKAKGITMLVSTPYMDEAQRCDRIALCNEGRVLGIDTPDGIVSRFDSRLYAVSARDMFALLQAVRTFEGVAACYPFGSVHHIVAGENFDAAALTGYLQANGLPDVHLEQRVPTIEDVFIKLMQR